MALDVDLGHGLSPCSAARSAALVASARGGGVNRQSATNPRIASAIVNSNASEIASGRAAAPPSRSKLRHQPVAIGRRQAQQRGDRGKLARQHLPIARGPERIHAAELNHGEPRPARHQQRKRIGIAREKRASSLSLELWRAAVDRRKPASRGNSAPIQNATQTACTNTARRLISRGSAVPAWPLSESASPMPSKPVSDRPRAMRRDSAAQLNRPANNAIAAAIAVMP